MYLLLLFENISEIAFSVKDYPHGRPVEIGFTIKPKPVIDTVIEVDVVALKTKVSTFFSRQ